MSHPKTDIRFIGSKADPTRAAEVSDEEFLHLIEGLDRVVMPSLRTTAVVLGKGGFNIVKLERRGSIASLVVQKGATKLSAWLYFQIHRSFAPLVSAERIFWSYSVRVPGRPVAAANGRIQGLDDPSAITDVICTFAEALAQPQQLASAQLP